MQLAPSDASAQDISQTHPPSLGVRSTAISPDPSPNGRRGGARCLHNWTSLVRLALAVRRSRDARSFPPRAMGGEGSCGRSTKQSFPDRRDDYLNSG